MKNEQAFFSKIIINMISFAIIAYLFSGVHIDNFLTLIAIAVLFGILTAFLKPVLTIITLPLSMTTFGIFYLILNGFYLWITQALVRGFVIYSFGTAIWAAVMLSIVSFLIEYLFFKHER